METYHSEQTISPQINFAREGVKIGIINAMIALLLMYGSYFAGMDAFVTEQFIAKVVPYMMIILIVYGIQLRKRNGGFLAFKNALQYSFMSYVIVAVLVAIGTYILFNLIDKELTKKVYDILMAKMTALGMKAEELEKTMGKREDQQTGLKNIFLGTGTGLIWDFVVSLIVALIIRKEKPVV